MSAISGAATHVVSNQPPPLEHVDLWATDRVLRETLARFAPDYDRSPPEQYGPITAELWDAARLANTHPPVFKPFDRFGHRIDQVEFHPGYHALMAAAIGHGAHAQDWDTPGSGALATRLAIKYLHGQLDAGTMCPLTMTHASIPALRTTPALYQRFAAKILSRTYDPRFRKPDDKAGLTVGMGMTEKQGGSDIRANTTRATPIGDAGEGQEYAITGHKWFMSAPMCDLFLVTAQTPEGPSCFLMPRVLDNGSSNAIEIQRLKDKLGDRSNASSEVEFKGARGWLLGPPGRGVPTILNMVMQTRIDCMMGSAAIMRQASAQALHHAKHREAFGKKLVDQPLMQNVLADLAIESEAALALSLFIAKGFDKGASDHDKALGRIGTAIGKYWVCKRAPMMINEAQECLGGAGFVEESILPRLYRQAPLNSIWEGSGNVQCLDVLRALGREPECAEALAVEFALLKAVHEDLDAAIQSVHIAITDRAVDQYGARRLTESLALILQAAALKEGDSDVFIAFCESRFGGSGRMFGTLPSQVNCAAIIERAMPTL